MERKPDGIKWTAGHLLFLGQHTSAFEEKLNPREVENLRKNWQSFALSHRRQSQVAKTRAKQSLAHQKSRLFSPSLQAVLHLNCTRDSCQDEKERKKREDKQTEASSAPEAPSARLCGRRCIYNSILYLHSAPNLRSLWCLALYALC